MTDQSPRRPDGPWTAGRAHRQAGADPYGRTEQFPPAHAPTQRFAAPPPTEPLAHEGGYPYGMPPAAPYPGHDQFVPQHLHMPPPQQYMPGPYPPQFGYPQPVQQMVVVNQGKRVNHALHLVLTLITAGLWLPVWIIVAIANS